MGLIDQHLANPDLIWCEKNKPIDGHLAAYDVFREAHFLSSYAHLAAVFGVSEEEISKYRVIIERARLISEHEYFKKLQDRVRQDDRDAIRIYAEMLKIMNMDKTPPINPEEEMTVTKVTDILKTGR